MPELSLTEHLENPTNCVGVLGPLDRHSVHVGVVSAIEKV
jgi:hypothetical protein